MAMNRKIARKLAAEAAKSEVAVLGGQLVTDGSRYVINKTDINALLDALSGQNVLLIIGPVADDETKVIKTCMTCGEEYSGDNCPRCANVWDRLRGEESGKRETRG